MTFSEPRYDGSGGGGPAMGGFAWPPLTPMVKRIVIANLAIYALCLLAELISPSGVGGGGAYHSIAKTFGLAPDVWRAYFPFEPVWQIVTYGFVHEVRPGHVLFNMLGLYFFGGMVETTVGSTRFLVTYMVAIVVGGLAFLVVGLISGSVPVVGASGGVLAMIVAAATFRPNAMVIFILFPVPLKILAGVLVGMDVIYWALASRGGGGGNTAYLVHIVGAAIGFLAVRRGWIWKDPVEDLRRKRAVKLEVTRQKDEHHMDELLQKIHREGMTSLSRSEREFLKRVSKRH